MSRCVTISWDGPTTLKLLQIIQSSSEYRSSFFPTGTSRIANRWKHERDICIVLFGKELWGTDAIRIGLPNENQDGTVQPTEKWTSSFADPVRSKLEGLRKKMKDRHFEKEYKVDPAWRSWDQFPANIRKLFRAQYPWYLILHELYYNPPSHVQPSPPPLAISSALNTSPGPARKGESSSSASSRIPHPSTSPNRYTRTHDIPLPPRDRLAGSRLNISVKRERSMPTTSATSSRDTSSHTSAIGHRTILSHDYGDVDIKPVVHPSTSPLALPDIASDDKRGTKRQKLDGTKAKSHSPIDVKPRIEKIPLSQASSSRIGGRLNPITLSSSDLVSQSGNTSHSASDDEGYCSDPVESMEIESDSQDSDSDNEGSYDSDAEDGLDETRSDNEASKSSGENNVYCPLIAADRQGRQGLTDAVSRSNAKQERPHAPDYKQLQKLLKPYRPRRGTIWTYIRPVVKATQSKTCGLRMSVPRLVTFYDKEFGRGKNSDLLSKFRLYNTVRSKDHASEAKSIMDLCMKAGA